MDYTIKCAGHHEKVVYQRYVDKCAMFYASSTLAVFSTAFVSMIAPLITADQSFPTDSRYPFNVEYEPVKSIIFLHEIIVIWQCFSIVCHCCFIGLLILFAAARFDILSQQFRKVTNIHDITVCIRQHIKLLRYAQEVITAVRSLILTVIIICTWVIIASGLTIVGKSTFADKVQFMILCITGLMEVYACAWPADHLIDASTNVAQAVYELLWYDQNKIIQKNVCFILLRSQTPMIVSISIILPTLSLQYYASYVSTALSYLMTLRIVFLENDEIKN
ncbi:hypothetical protein P5V15_003979 [Pogonomyrmex californicus]